MEVALLAFYVTAGTLGWFYGRRFPKKVLSKLLFWCGLLFIGAFPLLLISSKLPPAVGAVALISTLVFQWLIAPCIVAFCIFAWLANRNRGVGAA